MIITKIKPFTKDEIEKLKELFDVYIKTVIDVNKEICSAWCDRHFDSEKLLLEQESEQKNIWDDGIDLETKIIDCNSMINIRPSQGNASNEIQDAKIKKIWKTGRVFF